MTQPDKDRWFLVVIRDGDVRCFIRDDLDMIHQEIAAYFSSFEEVDTRNLEYNPTTRLNELDNSYFVIKGTTHKLFTKIGTVRYRNDPA